MTKKSSQAKLEKLLPHMYYYTPVYSLAFVIMTYWHLLITLRH